MERGGDTACFPVNSVRAHDGHRKMGEDPANRDVSPGGVSTMQYLPHHMGGSARYPGMLYFRGVMGILPRDGTRFGCFPLPLWRLVARTPLRSSPIIPTGSAGVINTCCALSRSCAITDRPRRLVQVTSYVSVCSGLCLCRSWCSVIGVWWCSSLSLCVCSASPAARFHTPQCVL